MATSNRVHRSSADPRSCSSIDIPDASPGEGELAVRVEAAGVNPIDWKLGRDCVPLPPSPNRAGWDRDAAGVITAVGPGVDGFVSATRWSSRASPVRTPPTSWSRRRRLDPSAPGDARRGRRAGGAGRHRVPDRSFPGCQGGRHLAGARRLRAPSDRPSSSTPCCGARPFWRPRQRRGSTACGLSGPIPIAYGPGLADRVRAVAPGGISVAIDAAGTDEALETSRRAGGRQDADRDARPRPRRPGLRHPRVQRWQPRTPHPAAERLADRGDPGHAGADGGWILLGRGRPDLPLAEAAEAHRTGQAGARGKIVLLP